MDIKPIKTEAQYRETLKEIEGLMSAQPDTPDGDRLDVLVTLVEAYEAKHYPIDLPDPIEAIKFRMEQQALTVQDLVPLIGRTNRVYEVLKGVRPLSLGMMRKLNSVLGIPAEVLIQAPKLKPRRKSASI